MEKHPKFSFQHSTSPQFDSSVKLGAARGKHLSQHLTTLPKTSKDRPLALVKKLRNMVQALRSVHRTLIRF